MAYELKYATMEERQVTILSGMQQEYLTRLRAVSQGGAPPITEPPMLTKVGPEEGFEEVITRNNWQVGITTHAGV